MDEKIKIWYDPESHLLEISLCRKAGYFRETSQDQVMEKIDMDGRVIGFSILKVSALRGEPLELSLA